MRAFFAAVVLALGMASPAYAVSFTVDEYSISHFTETPGNQALNILVTELMEDDHDFVLNSVGQTHTVDLFQIRTNESTIEADDILQKIISVGFQFSAPAPGFNGTETGLTGGTYIVPGSGALTGLCIIAGGCGYVVWDAPQVLNFGTTGLLQIQLTDELFFTPGGGIVKANFTLLQQDTLVHTPEPGTMALVATGLAAAAARLRRRARKSKQV